MNKFQRRVITALAAGSLLLNAVVPVFATTTLEISGNGADSKNEVELEFEHEVTVTQSNVANVLNDVKVEAETGDNEAEKNTGGDVEIKTGDATTTVTVANTLNSNVASVDPCCLGDVEAKITGNGADSENEIEIEAESEVKVNQFNVANVWNYVDAEAETGGNEAEKNTGGDVKIKTGDASATVSVSTSANSNSAWISGGGGGSLSAIISGNGANSENEIELELESEVELIQSNIANILNDVKVEAETGDNEAEKNTGGTVEIDTGDATADVTVDNLVNFNWADIEGCGCIEDFLAKISGNGADSENEIEAELETEVEATQFNVFDCKKELGDACATVDAEVSTGDNEAEKNTVGGEDPTIETGDASATVDVTNSANANVFGGLPPLDWPDWPDLLDGFSLNITLDLSLLLALLGLA